MTPGDVFLVDFPDVGGHEQHGKRPAVVIQDDGYAGVLRTTHVVPLSAQQGPARFPGVVPITPTPANGLSRPSYALVFQARVTDRRRFLMRLGRIDAATLSAIHDALDRLTGRVRPVPPTRLPPPPPAGTP